MRRVWRAHPVISVILIALLLVGPLAAEEPSELSVRLWATLDGFAKRNSLTEAQMWKLLDRNVLEGPNLRKGGIGMVDKDVYIVLDDKKNTIFLPDRDHAWQGRNSGDREIVIIEGNRILGAMKAANFSDVHIIMFSPKEARYINLAHDSGGTYRRFVK
jgi:hypothetical protein